jgi:hypothetical protein
VTATISEQRAAMSTRVVVEALDQVHIEARLRTVVSDAIERAPSLAAWASGRLALMRTPVVLVSDQDYPLIWIER